MYDQSRLPPKNMNPILGHPSKRKSMDLKRINHKTGISYRFNGDFIEKNDSHSMNRMLGEVAYSGLIFFRMIAKASNSEGDNWP